MSGSVSAGLYDLSLPLSLASGWKRTVSGPLSVLSNASPLFNIKRPQTLVLSVTGFINGQREWLD